MKKKSQRGFTLIELMIVVAIIGILAAIAIPAFLEYMSKSKQTEAQLQLRSMETKAKTYYNQKQNFPGSTAAAFPTADDPNDACLYGKQPVSAWVTASPNWQVLGFHVDESTRYQYQWTQGGAVGPTATGTGDALAHPNCDIGLVQMQLVMTAPGNSPSAQYNCKPVGAAALVPCESI